MRKSDGGYTYYVPVGAYHSPKCKRGIVKDEALYAVVEQRLRSACADAGLQVQAWLDSPIAGGDGNREFFISARRPA